MDTTRDRRSQEESIKAAEQAADWVITLDEAGPAERAVFAEWIEESPLHVEMFLRATAVSRMGELLTEADRKKLTDSVVAGVSHSNVVSLGASPAPEPLQPRESRRGRMRELAGWAAAVVLLLTGAVALWWSQEGWDTYATKVGEQRVVQLADGSMLYVNTDTCIEVRYSKRARELKLRNGEALFKVVHDSTWPFRVQVGDATVQALGTEFNIYRRPSRTTVAVIEGVAQVSRSGESARAAERLKAGQAVNIAASGPIERPIAVNPAQVTAWRERRLVFESETLEAIAAEFNRYNPKPHIRIEGESLRARRYTAVFDADNPQALLKFLARDADLAFAAEGNDFVIRDRGSAH